MSCFSPGVYNLFSLLKLHPSNKEKEKQLFSKVILKRHVQHASSSTKYVLTTSEDSDPSRLRSMIQLYYFV